MWPPALCPGLWLVKLSQYRPLIGQHGRGWRDQQNMTLTAHTLLMLTHEPLYSNLGFRVKKLRSCSILMSKSSQQRVILQILSHVMGSPSQQHTQSGLGQSAVRSQRKDVNVNTAIKLMPPIQVRLNSLWDHSGISKYLSLSEEQIMLMPWS